MIRELSPAGLTLIKLSEGLKDGDPRTPNLDPYLDDVGVWTIGYGHAIWYGNRLLRGSADEALARSLYPNGITLPQADTLCAGDALEACRDVARLVTTPLTQGQFDALVDFVFNLGPGALVKSTLLKKLNAGDYGAAALELPKWKYGGKPPRVLDGLVTRRGREVSLWNGLPLAA